MFARVEELVVGRDLRPGQHESFEFDVIAVGRPPVLEGLLYKAVEPAIAFFCALKVDAAAVGCAFVVWAETGNAGGVDGLGVAYADGVEEGAVAFVEEQDSVDVIGAAKVAGHRGPEFPYVRIEEAECAAFPALKVDLVHFFYEGHICGVAESVLYRTDGFHAAVFRLLQYFGKDVAVSEVRSF